jgi:hypothetical protein
VESVKELYSPRLDTILPQSLDSFVGAALPAECNIRHGRSERTDMVPTNHSFKGKYGPTLCIIRCKICTGVYCIHRVVLVMMME